MTAAAGRLATMRLRSCSNAAHKTVALHPPLQLVPVPLGSMQTLETRMYAHNGRSKFKCMFYFTARL